MEFDLRPMGERPPEDVFVKILVMGDSGAGKTAFASRANADGDLGKTLILLVEPNGEATIREFGPHSIVVDAHKEAKRLGSSPLEVLREFMRCAMVGEFDRLGVRTIVIDSATEVQQLIKDEILSFKKPDATGMKEIAGRDWNHLKEKMRRFLRTCRDLPYDVVMLARLRVDDVLVDGEKVDERLLPLFQGSIVHEVAGYFSAVAMAFKREVAVLDGKGESTGGTQVVYRLAFSGPSRILLKSCGSVVGTVPPDTDAIMAALRGQGHVDPIEDQAPTPDVDASSGRGRWTKRGWKRKDAPDGEQRDEPAPDQDQEEEPAIEDDPKPDAPEPEPEPEAPADTDTDTDTNPEPEQPESANNKKRKRGWGSRK